MKTSSLLQERHVENWRDDRLNREPFIDNIIRALVIEEKDLTGKIVGCHSSGAVIGLTGKWGSGKSSVVHLLADQLGKKDHVVVAVLNPWLVNGRDELITSFFGELRDSIGRNTSENIRQILETLDKYRDAITLPIQAASLLADASGGSGILATLTKYATNLFKSIFKPRVLSAIEERRSLEKKLAEARVAVVVLIDELDRVEDADVRAVAQLVKAIGDIRGISYLVAYDPDRVVDALGRGDNPARRQSGEAYLEKLIQYSIPLRPLFGDDVERFFSDLLEHHDLKLPNDLSEGELTVIDYITGSAETPRELKRLVGAYVALERMLRGEVSAADLLGYCWLLTKAPTLRDRIAENLDYLVDDPDPRMALRRAAESLSMSEPDIKAVLGAEVAPHEGLISLLFPRFKRADHTNEGHRLSRRRNLVRVLYLGNPPGMATRSQVEALWNERDATVLEENLTNLNAKGELKSIVDRLDDLFTKLPEQGDTTFWSALSKVLVREKQLPLEPGFSTIISDDGAAYLFNLGARDVGQRNRVKGIVSALENVGDIVFVPYIIRRHLFRWGLVAHDSNERFGGFIYDKKETEALLDANIHIYKQAVLREDFLRRVPSSEVLYTIINAGRWDADLRQSLTSQLMNPESRAYIASLLTPPGLGIERDILDTMIDAGKVFSAMEAANEGIGQSTWIEKSLRRFRLTLSGHETIFSDDIHPS